MKITILYINLCRNCESWHLFSLCHKDFYRCYSGNASATSNRQRRSIGWSIEHNSAVVLNAAGNGIAVAGPVAFAAAVTGFILRNRCRTRSCSLVGPTSTTIVGSFAVSATVVGPAANSCRESYRKSFVFLIRNIRLSITNILIVFIWNYIIINENYWFLLQHWALWLDLQEQ